MVPLDTVPKASLRLPLYTCKVTTSTVVPAYSTSLCVGKVKILQDGARERRTLTRIQEGASSAASIFMTPMTSPFCSTSPPTHPFPSPHPYPHDLLIHLLLIHFYLTIPLLLLHSHLFIHLILIHFHLLLHLHNLLFIHFHLLLPHLLIHLHLLLLKIQVDLDQDAPQLPSSISSFSE